MSEGTAVVVFCKSFDEMRLITLGETAYEQPPRRANCITFGAAVHAPVCSKKFYLAHQKWLLHDIDMLV